MSKNTPVRIGTSYTHQHASMRVQNSLYDKTEPARFAFNDKACAANDVKVQGAGTQTALSLSRTQRKAAFITRRKAQVGHAHSHVYAES